MKGFHTYRWLFLLPLLLMIALQAASAQVLIVKSRDNRFFNRSIEALISHSKQQLKYRIMTVDQLQQQTKPLERFEMVITLGLQATEYASAMSVRIPVIHSYITHKQFLSHAFDTNHHSILLDQPLTRYLQFVKALLGSPAIGVLQNSEQALPPNRIRALEKQFDIQLQQHLLQNGENPIKAARHLLQSIDVLLALPNAQIYNRHTLKGILLTAYRQHKPMVTYSPAQVKTGALAAIFSTPEHIGRQLAELLDQIMLQPKQKIARFYYAKYYDITINRRVAESLELETGSKESLLKQMKIAAGSSS